MKIAAISDTLGNLPAIEGQYDVFIHCGNFCPIFDSEPLVIQIDNQLHWVESEFNSWLDSIDAKCKILVPGHCDFAVFKLDKDFQWHVRAEVLINESIIFKQKIIYGFSWLAMPTDNSSIFSKTNIGKNAMFVSKSREHFVTACKNIPDNVNMLISRTPPFGILDKTSGQHIGSQILLDKVKLMPSIKSHIFGSAYDEGGRFKEKSDILFVNALAKSHVEIET